MAFYFKNGDMQHGTFIEYFPDVADNDDFATRLYRDGTVEKSTLTVKYLLTLQQYRISTNEAKIILGYSDVLITDTTL